MPSETDAKGPISNLIRRLRFDHGEMTQQELAQRVGVTRQTIIALEAGKYFPSLLLAFRLARAFGVSVEGVFQYHDGELNPAGVSVQDG
jgi:putative transcriptional regulator